VKHNMDWPTKPSEIYRRSGWRIGWGPEREPKRPGGTSGELAGRSSGRFDVLSKAHLAPAGARRIAEVRERKPPGGLWRFIERPEAILPGRDLEIDIIVWRAPRGSTSLVRRKQEGLPDGVVKAPAQLTRELAIVLETEAERLGDGDDVLADGDLAQNLPVDLFGKERGAFLVTRRAEASSLATIRQKVLIMALLATNPGQTSFQATQSGNSSTDRTTTARKSPSGTFCIYGQFSAVMLNPQNRSASPVSPSSSFGDDPEGDLLFRDGVR